MKLRILLVGSIAVASLLAAGDSLALASQPASSEAQSSASAQPAPSATPAQQRPVTDQTVTAKDVATTPLSDLNIKKQPVPPVLAEAVAEPYSLAGMTSCGHIAGEVRQLDAALGEDLDVQKARGETLSAGSLAKSVVGSFIPFEGVIREISGAHEEQRRMQLAIYAGIERRGFLKGVGEQRGCPLPARPATGGGLPAHHRGGRH